MTNGMLISFLAFLVVSGVVGLLAFVLRDGSPKASARLDTLLSGKKTQGARRKDRYLAADGI